MGNLLEFWHLFLNWPIVVGQNPTCFVMKAEQLQEWSICAVLWTLSRTERKWKETLSEVWWTIFDRPETVSWSQYRCRCSIGVVIEIRSKTACQSCRNRSTDPCSCKRPDVAHFDFQVHHTAANDAVFRVVVGMVCVLSEWWIETVGCGLLHQQSGPDWRLRSTKTLPRG